MLIPVIMMMNMMMMMRIGVDEWIAGQHVFYVQCSGSSVKVFSLPSMLLVGGDLRGVWLKRSLVLNYLSLLFKQVFLG